MTVYFRFPEPLSKLCPEPKHFTAKYDQNIVKYAEKWTNSDEK